MDPSNSSNADPVHLPVVPTGRVEALKQQVGQQSGAGPAATASAGPSQPTGEQQSTGAGQPAAAASADPTSSANATSSATSGSVEAAGSAASPGASSSPLTDIERKLLEGKVIATIQQIYDPEIPVNIYELGLIYKVDVRDDRSIHVLMTLTAPACPVAGSLPGQVEQKIETIPEVTKATVELVWDPPWSRDMMSEAAQLQLGLM